MYGHICHIYIYIYRIKYMSLIIHTNYQQLAQDFRNLWQMVVLRSSGAERTAPRAASATRLLQGFADAVHGILLLRLAPMSLVFAGCEISLDEDQDGIFF